MKRTSLLNLIVLFLLVLLSAAFTNLNAENPNADDCNLSGFMTFTQGGWGSPNNSGPGKIREDHFTQVFSSGLIAGSVQSKQLKLTTSTAVKNFVPQGGTAAAFDNSYVDVTSTSAGVLGGQLVAAIMNVEYDNKGYLGSNSLKLKDLTIKSGTFQGKKVSELIAIANNTVSGVSTGYTFSQVSDALTSLNENFDNGTVDKGFLTCSSSSTKSSLGDKVWLDSDKDGKQDSGENGVQNVTVKLYDCTDHLQSTKTTNVNGNYLFDNLSAGDYSVKFELPNSTYQFTTKDAGSDDAKDSDADVTTGKTTCVTLPSSTNNLTLDAGIYLKSASLGDKVWFDTDKDGIQDAGEAGVGNITVRLYDCSNNFITSMATGSDGEYLFSNLEAKQYYIKIDLPVGYVLTLKNQGSDDAKDSDLDSTTLQSACVNLNAGDVNLTLDAGIYQNILKISPILECVEKLSENSYKAYFGYNNPNSFQVDYPVGSNNSFNPAPSDRHQPTVFNAGRTYKAFSVAFDGNSLVWSLNGKTATASKTSKSCQASIGDKVWLDLDKDGIQDAGESGVPNITVKLYDCNDVFIATLTTDANGNYLFSSLNPGSYYLKFELPSSYIFTKKDQGANDSVDSDADMITGKTSCTVLSESETDITWDAGVYTDAPIQCITTWTGTLGPDESLCEPLAKWITINGSVTLTPNPGKAKLQLSWRVVHPKDLNNCPSGAEPCIDEHYISKWIYGDTTFSISAWWPGISSNDTLVEIHYGLNVLDCDGNPIKNGVGKDIYWYPWVCPPPQGPKPKVTKDDGLLIMPEKGKTTTYTINYKNEGAANLLNAKLIDVLPDEVSFVSATGSPQQNGDTISWTLGTLTAGQSGSFNLTVKVENEISEYTNKVKLFGFDDKNKEFKSESEDINIADTSSGGATAGVESNGNLAELLLKRLIKIQYKQTSVMMDFKKATFNSSIQLSDLIPPIGPYSSYAQVTTPFDIAGISNATSSYATDYFINYNNGKRRIGGIFATTTNPPYIYDHTKQTCDRLNEYKLMDIQLIYIDGFEFYASKLQKSSVKVTDYSISFSVYEMPDGFRFESKWTFNDYKVPADAFVVYNFQVWSSSMQGSIDLVKKLIDKFKSFGKVEKVEDFANLPTVFIQDGAYNHTGNSRINIINNNLPQQVDLKIKYRLSQGGELKESSRTLNLSNGVNPIDLNTGIISDAKLYLSTSNNFKDELFLSGGAFTYFAGTSSTVAKFNTIDYQADDINNYPVNALLLSGGFSVNGQLKDWINIFRTLKGNATSYNLTDYNKISFNAKGSGKLNIYIEQSGTQNYNYFMKTIDLNQSGSLYELNLKTFIPRNGGNQLMDVTKIEKIGFSLEKGSNSAIDNYDFEVKNIYFSKKSESEVDPEIPLSFELKQNYPNPFNPATQIEYFVGISGHISLKVYDMLGQNVATLFEGFKSQGPYKVTFNPNGLGSGTYIYKLETGSATLSKKMIYIK